MGKQHIIELNGKRYDAVTGRMVTTIGSGAHVPTRTRSAIFTPKGMDGFSTAPRPAARSGNPTPTHKVHKSTTLMRTIVKKPEPPKTPEKVATKPKIASFTSVSKDKLAHAQAIPKSTLVRRFSHDTFSRPTGHPTANAIASISKPKRVQAVATAHAVQKHPLSAALANAESHNEPKSKPERRHVRVARRLKISPRVVSAGTIVLAGLLIGGFFAYQNVPNLNMRLASARAGVQGSLPGYRPSGFGLNGGIVYKPGEIVIGYKSHADERNFKITQANSSWNSETLLDNYLVANQKEYQVVAEKGKTVYLYEGSNATWVDGGIWYKIEGNSQLNSDQLLSLANSL